MKAIQYKGYTIEPAYFGFDFYKTDSGIDCNCEEGNWKSNVNNASTIERAKADIDDLIDEEEYALREERNQERVGEMNHLKEQDTER